MVYQFIVVIKTADWEMNPLGMRKDVGFAFFERKASIVHF